jgi:hypothetical protein
LCSSSHWRGERPTTTTTRGSSSSPSTRHDSNPRSSSHIIRSRHWSSPRTNRHRRRYRRSIINSGGRHPSVRRASEGRGGARTGHWALIQCLPHLRAARTCDELWFTAWWSLREIDRDLQESHFPFVAREGAAAGTDSFSILHCRDRDRENTESQRKSSPGQNIPCLTHFGSHQVARQAGYLLHPKKKALVFSTLLSFITPPPVQLFSKQGERVRSHPFFLEASGQVGWLHMKQRNSPLELSRAKGGPGESLRKKE